VVFVVLNGEKWGFCWGDEAAKTRFDGAPKDGKMRRFMEFLDSAASWSWTKRSIALVSSSPRRKEGRDEQAVAIECIVDVEHDSVSAPASRMIGALTVQIFQRMMFCRFCRPPAARAA
jgi:hypothetical protein